jgi:hypothetical protein
MGARTALTAATLNILLATSVTAGEAVKPPLEDRLERPAAAVATIPQLDLFNNVYDVKMGAWYWWLNIIPVRVSIAGIVGRGSVDLRLSALGTHYSIRGEYKRGEPVEISCLGDGETFGANGSFDGTRADLTTYKIIDGRQVYRDTIHAVVKGVGWALCPGKAGSCLDLVLQIRTDSGSQRRHARLVKRAPAEAAPPYALSK